jgi:hypothetical protein
MAIKHRSLSSIAISTLTAIAAAVIANPKAYHQDKFVTDFESENEAGCVAFYHSKLTATARALKLRVKKNEVWLNTPKLNSRYEGNPFFEAAKKDLKLTDAQAQRLLGEAEAWPKKFYDQYENAKTAKGRARALFNRIAFFIATDGLDKTARELAAEAEPKA